MAQKAYILTMEELLTALHVDRSQHRKTKALISVNRAIGIEVHEHFDDGKGHSNCLSCTAKSIHEHLLYEAKVKGFVAGVLKYGYTSTTELAITDAGERELRRLRSESLQR